MLCTRRRGRDRRDPSFRPISGGVASALTTASLPPPKISGLVNQAFTKTRLRQRTRFFVAERRSSLLGRGALVVMTKAPLFFLAAARAGDAFATLLRCCDKLAENLRQ